MVDEYTVDHRSTYEHFLHVLSIGKNQYGSRLDLDALDDGVKDLLQLFDETQEQDCVLRYNPRTERVERHANSVWISIYELRRCLVWLEIARSWHPKGIFIAKQKKITATETLKPWELPIHGMLRCFNWEEFRKKVESIGGLLKSVELIPSLAPHMTDRHESTVYTGIPSIVTIRERYELYLDFWRPGTSLGSEIIVTKDCVGHFEEGKPHTRCYLKALDDPRTGIR